MGRRRYVRGNDLVYSDKGGGNASGEGNASREASEKQYYVTDPHGNVVQLTDENGKVIKTYEYDSFGNEVKPDSKDDNPFRYCGEYYDKEIGEIYLRARYYQPEVGRFLTRDTYTGEEDEPESLHLYAYCYNNPVYYIDAAGNKPTKPQPLPTPKPAKKTPQPPMPQPGPGPNANKGFTAPGKKELLADEYMYLTRNRLVLPSSLLRAKSNYKKNRKIEALLLKKQYKQKYITDQGKLASLKFGKRDMAYAGCELIAIYNAILLKTKKAVSLSKIIYQCEISGYSTLHINSGEWGTNPYRIGKLLTKFGVKYSMVGTNNWSMKKGSVYIVSYWNRRDVNGGVHTIAVKVKKKNRIETYNKEYSDKPGIVKGKLKKLLKGKPFIIGYKLRGKQK